MSSFPISDFEDAASSAIDRMRDNIDKWSHIMNLKKSGKSLEKEVIVTDPAFQWAQSLNHTYINVKYSKKLDSPGYLDVKNETVTFTDQGVVLSGDVEKVKLKYKVGG